MAPIPKNEEYIDTLKETQTLDLLEKDLNQLL